MNRHENPQEQGAASGVIRLCKTGRAKPRQPVSSVTAPVSRNRGTNPSATRGKAGLQYPRLAVGLGPAADAERITFLGHAGKDGALELRQVFEEVIPHGPPPTRAAVGRNLRRATTGCGVASRGS